MRIHIVTNEAWPEPGNRARRVAQKASFLTARGHEVRVHAPGPGPDSATLHMSGTRPDHEILRHGAIGEGARSWSGAQHGDAPRTKGLMRLVKGFAPWALSLGFTLRRECRPGDVLVTLNNPIALHLAGLLAPAGVHWVAELRDPISGYETGRLGRLADAVARYEGIVASRCDALILRQGIQVDAATLRARHPGAAGRIHEVPDYGVDLTAFEDFSPRRPPAEHIRGIYAGGLYEGLPAAALVEALAARPDLDFAFVGDRPVPDAALPSGVGWTPRVPFEAILDRYRAVDFAVVLLAQGIQGGGQWMPSKVCELLAARLPLLVVGPPEHALALRVERDALGVAAPPEKAAIAQALERLAAGLRAGRFDVHWVDRHGAEIDAGRYERACLDVIEGLAKERP